MSIFDQAPGHIRAISPYVPGKPITQLARELDLDPATIIKLASNENPRGMSPRARAAVEAALSGVALYPDQFELVNLLAERLGVGREQIILGSGSNDILDLTARAFLMPGRSAVSSQYAFPIYVISTLAAGGENIVTPARHYGHDLVAMAAAVRPDTRLIWIANPNNPTGTFLSYAALRRFIEALPRDVVVMLDEAYNEYLAPADREESVAWIRDFPNLVITRTFSKVYGLAGLRVGFGVASPEVADLLNRIRMPFNVNNLALEAARAALDDHLFLAESYALNRRGMEQLVAGFKRLGLEYIPSYGNFIAVQVGNAPVVNEKLLRQGVIVRPVGVPGFLRITVGLEQENARFLVALDKALHS
ncbi:MAG: histidinol-phosphate transaminase [Proteobacteria bacterium]|nr:histidinol-phosphate transaminase [Pseudomonadota bacterium]HQR02992.1 histidinol-phosphate transaminase [Rhodocyclaceae bacterium]